MDLVPADHGQTSTIRLATEADAQQIAEIYGQIVRDTVISFEMEPPSIAEMRARITSTLERLPWLVCEDHPGETVLGYVYAGPHASRAGYRWSVDVSAYVREGARRSGVGRRLYTALFSLLRRQGYRNAYAGITLPNPASVGLHEAMGFRPVGVYEQVGYKFGAWQDVGWWQLAVQDRVADPEAPIDLPALAGTSPLTARPSI